MSATKRTGGSKTEEMSTRVQEVFSRYDKDGSGLLDKWEMQKVFSEICPRLDLKQCEGMYREIDPNADGQVSCEEFMAWLKKANSAFIGQKLFIDCLINETGGSVASRVREIFARFDSDSSGILDMTELSKVFRTLDPDILTADIGKLCKQLDKGGDGSVSHNEFVAWIKLGSPAAKQVARKIESVTGEARETRVRAAFDLYDATGDGNLDVPELRQALRMMGHFSNDEIMHVCADLDKSGDGLVSYQEFKLWMRDGTGAREIHKAKAILAPADSDGLEAVFYSFCGPGRAEMDNKGLVKIAKDSGLIDERLSTVVLDLLFNDLRVKPKGRRVINFFEFEVCLEFMAEKKGVNKSDLRMAILNNGGPKIAGTVAQSVHVGKGSAEASGSKRPKKQLTVKEETQKRVRAVLKEQDAWKRDADVEDLWKKFGMDNAAGRMLKKMYSPDVEARSRSKGSRMNSKSSESLQNTYSAAGYMTNDAWMAGHLHQKLPDAGHLPGLVGSTSSVTALNLTPYQQRKLLEQNTMSPVARVASLPAIKAARAGATIGGDGRWPKLSRSEWPVVR